MQKQSETDRALDRKYPEQVVIVTTRSPKGTANAMAAGWVTIASGDPLMFALVIDHGAYTYELINRTRQFVVAFPSDRMGKAVLHVGSHHGRGRDKLAECGLATQKASRVAAPLIADAVANFECELVNVYKPGDCPLIVGRVIAAHENRDAKVRRLYTVGPGHAMGGVRNAGKAVRPKA